MLAHRPSAQEREHRLQKFRANFKDRSRSRRTWPRRALRSWRRTISGAALPLQRGAPYIGGSVSAVASLAQIVLARSSRLFVPMHQPVHETLLQNGLTEDEASVPLTARLQICDLLLLSAGRHDREEF